MRAPDETGRKRFVGRLKGLRDGAAVVEVDGREVALIVDDMDKARLVPDL